jgi:adenylate cyclase
VTRLTRDDVASKAGVEPAYVDHLVDLGLITPAEDDSFSSGDVFRARWIRSLEASGLPLDGMAAAVRDGSLSFDYLDASAFERFGALTEITMQELSEAKGLPMGLLSVIREAVGFPEANPDDLVREEELAIAEAVAFQLEYGFNPTVIERLLRVYGDSLRRITETETDAYRSEVTERLLATGMSQAEMLEKQAVFGSQIGPLLERAFLAISHRNQERTWTRVWLDSVETALEEAGFHSRPHSPPAVGFLDLTGYTQLTEREGDEAAADLTARMRTLVRQLALEYDGDYVKFLGDGVMLYFPDPTSGVQAAISMVEKSQEESLPAVRAGIHAGPVVFQEGDYFGRTVNIAARLADYARPGEVLVTKEVVDSASNDELEFTDIGPVTLKGVAQPVEVLAAYPR